MLPRIALVLLISLSLVVAQEQPLTHLRLSYSAIIDADAEAVWSYIGDFADVTWIPGVISSKVINGSDNAPGAIRLVYLGNDHYSHEQLMQYSFPAFANTLEYRFEYQYMVLNITNGTFPGPLLNYLGTVVVLPVYQTNQSYAFWGLELDTYWSLKTSLASALQGALVATLSAVQKHFASAAL